MPFNYSFYFRSWTGTMNYGLFDVVGGATTGDTTFYYSTTLNNSGHFPASSYVLPITSHSRSDDVATINYTTTGNLLFYPGSIIAITGTNDSSYIYTGMVLKAGSGYLQYISAGYDGGANDTVGAINTTIDPRWTTGFFYMPSYSTPLETATNTIEAQFEPGYSQRQAASINPNINTWTLTFTDRSNKETRAIRNFVEDKGGVYPFPIMMPVSELSNLPNQLYIGTNPKLVTKSWNLNDFTVTVKRVFDI